ncbi:MAG TPA: tripartite tricarboxylate transporter substrate binding protein [Burkholderiales bacterium]|nr:tripartite tricarboxylate transporter substrate binding protein [Burkholderiales bacterium]
MRSLCFVVFIALAGRFVADVQAADYPAKPIRYIVATGAGGASDLLARVVAQSLSEILGVQIVVDNRPGAGNTVGAEIAARAVPDGYTLLSCNIASLAVGPALYKRLPYDAERDFAPLGLIASNPNAFSVNPSVQAKTLPELIALAKASPGKLNYASAGIGTSPQLSMELFKMQAGIDLVHIAYKGVGPGLLDLMAGRVQAMTSTVPAVLSSARSGKVRTLAITSKQRDSQLPDVPTVAESGLPDFEVVSWQGLCTNAGAPQAALKRLRGALATALAQPDTQKRIMEQGFQMYVMPADTAAAFMKGERTRWARLVKQLGVPQQ